MISTIYPAWEGVKTSITSTSIKSANLKRNYIIQLFHTIKNFHINEPKNEDHKKLLISA
jgi:hypothetical protein